MGTLGWEDILPHPSIALITGRRGAGKSALGYYLLQVLSTPEIPGYVMGLPKEKEFLLPPHIRILELGESLPENSIIFVDEAGFQFFSREAGSQFNKLINKLLSISRQRSQTIIFASHTLRKLDVGVVMDADAIIVKQPSRLHAEFERAEIRELIKQAFQIFSGIQDPIQAKRTSVVFSHELYGEIMENPLPSFWSEDLSRAFASVPVEFQPKPRITDYEISVLKRILEIERSKNYHPELGWEAWQVGLCSGATINKFLELGLIRPGHQSRSYHCYYGNPEKIKQLLDELKK